MPITIYLWNSTGVDLRAIVKGTYGETFPIFVPANQTVWVSGVSPGEKFLLTYAHLPPNTPLRPAVAQLIDAKAGYRYDLAPNGLPVQPKYGLPGKPATATQKRAAKDGTVIC